MSRFAKIMSLIKIARHRNEAAHVKMHDFESCHTTLTNKFTENFLNAEKVHFYRMKYSSP